MGSQETIRASKPRSRTPQTSFSAQTPLSPEAMLKEVSDGSGDLPLFGRNPPDAAFSLRTPTSSDASPLGSPPARVVELARTEGHLPLQRVRTRSSEGSPQPEERASGLIRRRRRSATPSDPSSPLIADLQLSRSRIVCPSLISWNALLTLVVQLISKTHVLYPPPSSMVPYRSAVLGFRAVLHPLSQARIKDAEIQIRFLPPMSDPSAVPIIKALYPAHLRTGDAQVTKGTEVSGGLTIGYDPFANLNIATSQTMDVTWTAHASIIGSGVETSVALFSLVENTLSHAGLDPTMDFAILLLLPSHSTSYFEAELTVEANVGKDSFSDLARRMLGSPRLFRLAFDGETEMGNLRMQNTGQP